MIDPGAITLIQTTFLEHINTAFDVVTHYALNLLYLFAVLELVIFGLLWALERDIGWGQLLFKILKIGLIFFVIQNYAWLTDTVIKSFAQLAGVTVNNHEISRVIFSPGKIWQYGYDAGVHLLQVATAGSNFGLVLIQIILGLGILLVFGLLGIQIILQLSGFYLIAFAALILLPFGTFTPSHNMFDKAVQSVLRAGVRVMTLIMVVGIAVVVWNGMHLTDMDATEAVVNINQPLGLFFTALVFLYLAIYLPKVAAKTVGIISSGGGLGNVVVVNTPEHAGGAVMSMGATSEVGGLSDMRAATTVDVGMQSGLSAMPITVGQTAVGSEMVTQTNAGVAGTMSTNGKTESLQSTLLAKEVLAKVQQLDKNISETTISKLKEILLQAKGGKS